MQNGRPYIRDSIFPVTTPGYYYMRKSIIKRFFLNWLTQEIKYFKKLNSSGYISYKKMNYFTYEYKNST